GPVVAGRDPVHRRRGAVAVRPADGRRDADRRRDRAARPPAPGDRAQAGAHRPAPEEPGGAAYVDRGRTAAAPGRRPGAAGVAVATQLHRAPAASRSAAAPPAADVGTADLAGPNLAPPLGQPLPAGLTWWYDPSGFVVPVPVGWKALPEGPKAVLFTEPSGP